MLKWKKIEASSYESKDGRFDIIKTYNVTFGNHWQLTDHNEPNYYKSHYHEYSLKDCKAKAEAIIEQEKQYGKK